MQDVLNINSRLSNVQNLINAAKGHLASGNASAALQCLLQALHLHGDQAALRDAVDRAQNGLSRSTEDTINQVSRLLEQLQLVTNQAARVLPESDMMDTGGGLPASTNLYANPILQETGREDLAQVATEDGSNYVCARCGGVVSNSRKQQHEQFWCEGR